MNKYLLGIALGVLAFSSSAQSAEFNYNTIGLTYTTGTQDIDGFDDEFTYDGYGVNLSVDVAAPIGIYANYASFKADADVTDEGTTYDLEKENSGPELGVFFHTPLAARTDLVIAAGVLRLHHEGRINGVKRADEDADGHALWAELRSMLSERVELFGGLRQREIEDSSTSSFGLGARYHPSERFALGVAYAQDMDNEQRSLAFSGELYF